MVSKKKYTVPRTGHLGGHTPDEKVFEIYKGLPVDLKRRVNQMFRSHLRACLASGVPQPRFGQFLIEAIEVASLESNNEIVASFARPAVKWEPAVHYPQYVAPKEK